MTSFGLAPKRFVWLKGFKFPSQPAPKINYSDELVLVGWTADCNGSRDWFFELCQGLNRDNVLLCPYVSTKVCDPCETRCGHATRPGLLSGLRPLHEVLACTCNDQRDSVPRRQPTCTRNP